MVGFQDIFEVQMSNHHVICMEKEMDPFRPIIWAAWKKFEESLPNNNSKITGISVSQDFSIGWVHEDPI